MDSGAMQEEGGSSFNPYTPPIDPGGGAGEVRSLRDRLAVGPLGLGELFSISWSIFAQNAGKIGLLSLLIQLPINLILAHLSLETQGDDWAGQFRSYWRAAQMLETFFGILVTLGVISMVWQSVEERSVRLGQAVRDALRRWLPAIGTRIMSGLMVLMMTLLLIVPGIIYYVYYTFVDQHVVLSEEGGSPALAHSKFLVSGRWWTVFGIMLLTVAIQFGGALIVGVVYALVTMVVEEVPVVEALLDTTTEYFATIFTIMFSVWYLNLDMHSAPASLAEPETP